MTAVAVSGLAFGLWHVLPARQVTTFNPVFAGLAGGQMGVGARRGRGRGRDGGGWAPVPERRAAGETGQNARRDAQ
jgi:hypothetical protein